MNILVVNPGSSSIKFGVYADGFARLRMLYEGELSGIGGDAKLTFRNAEGRDLTQGASGTGAASMTEGVALVEEMVSAAGLPRVDAVGYRVVHPGPKLKGHQRLTPEVLDVLRAAEEFAPLHDPAAVALMEEMMRRMPDVPHFACFDTVFHETMPEEATVYALPEVVRVMGVRRYGFHGLSCESIVQTMCEDMGDAAPRRMVIAHLGSGCSVTACVEGKSVDTTMGMTPTGGVVMGTRPGDLDPGVVFYLLRQPGATVDSLEAVMNHECGIRALGGVNDMRELRRQMESGDKTATMAIRVFCQSVARAVAGMIALHRADTVVFTGGIGENDAVSRGEIAMAAGLGAVESISLGEMRMRKITGDDARIAMFAAKTNEDGMIAEHVVRMLSEERHLN